MNVVRKTLYLKNVKASNGQEFLVRDLKDKQHAANRLGNLSDTLQRVCKTCKRTVSPKDKTRVDAVERLIDKFDPARMTENIPGSSHVAYSVNKGTELSICLRDKDSNRFVDDNTVRFVAIHELAHVMSESSGHTDEFWDNMKYLLENAISAGVYTPIDYSKSPENYCGTKITSTPLDL